MRTSGVLMPISSLPSPYGIGTMGKDAKKFVDFLEKGGQKYWQILPICPTSYGDSPYQSFSSFAGNPYFIDLDYLCKDKLLTQKECESYDWGKSAKKVDYGIMYINRYDLLKKAFARFKKNIPDDYSTFCKKEAEWLDEYTLFMALKDANDGHAWSQWDEQLKVRNEKAIKEAKEKYADDIEFYKMLQYLFFKQWKALKKYANEKGIEIIGDVPIYVAMDSADVWANPKQFYLDKELNPIEVAGCPPDAFSEDGQLWGNPLFRWDVMKKDNYSWWTKRIKAMASLYDIVRIDHFRGFDRYWAVPYGEETAINGEWKPAPGINFFTQLQANLGYDLPIIAEDLGEIDDSVIELRDKFNLPGMKILQFAFENPEENDFLPHNYTRNCVCYTGTHDNDTTFGWYQKAYEASKDKLRRYFSTDASDICWVMIRACFSSVANMAVVPMQDVLKLDSWARLNTPGVGEGNWAWRFEDKDMDTKLEERLFETAKLYGR